MAQHSTAPAEQTPAHARAVLAYLRADAEPVVPPLPPDSLAVRLLEMAKLVAAKDARALPALAAALRAAAPMEHRASAAEREHLAAARRWLARDALGAARIYTRIARANPRDLVAVRLAQSCWYFLGQRARMRVVAERALRRWPQGAPGYDVVLALTAFGRAEIGDGRGAAALAQRALALEPRSPFARHALAHGLIAQGRTATAHRMLDESQPLWRVGGRMDAHNAWHLALLELQIGRPLAALTAFDREFTAPHDASTCADATDLLCRLDLAGIDVGRRWQRLAAAWARHLTPGFWGYLDVLAGLAFHRAGRTDEARALAKAQEGAHRGSAAARAAIAAVEAFTRGDHALVGERMRTALPGIGGSAPQRELLESIWHVARRRAGESRVAAAA
jgi:hypothetical protein